MFKWVHMSDIHFTGYSTFNDSQIKEKLTPYLENLGPVDALFLTGDFRFAKDFKGNAKEIANYIKCLAMALKVKSENIICVPGNHDLDRGDLRTAAIEATVVKYDRDKGDFSDEILQQFKRGFSFFDQIEEELGHTTTVMTHDNVHFVKHLNQVDLLLLNTAITAGREDERGALLLGTKYLKDEIKKLDSQKPIIALGHHGSSFLDADEFKVVSTLFKDNNISLYLCGHEHALWQEMCGQGLNQITSGCICDDKGNVTIGFATGCLNDDNTVEIKFHEWFSDRQIWGGTPGPTNRISIGPRKQGKNPATQADSSQAFVLPAYLKKYPRKEYLFSLNGHTLLGGRGRDGIKYYWKKNGDRVESVAFNKRLCEPDPAHEAEDLNISAYTISTSFGCVLSASNQQCRFCETGSRTFKGFLSADEIAMQSIFMACYDADCPSFPEVRTHKREFAFMGQGEPGLNYSAVREAIRLTDCAMEALNQKVHRYVISSCGIDTFIPALIDDINSDIFKNKVSLHFSLHGVGKTRTDLMPIGKEYDYREFINSCERFYNAMKDKYGVADKIGVGLLMFKNFVPTVRAGEVVPSSTTLNVEQLSEILKELDPNIFRIDLSDFNNTSVTESAEEMSNEEAHDLLTCATDLGFEAKIFSSFGRDRHSGCGMLKSEYLDVAEDGSKTIEKYHTALDLLHYSVQKVKK
jgi:adenine C2-methylase RlmN of 23S rRNA A2503 and tRNA A37/predicted MPP superfamily phosphohydrolase